MKQPTPTNSQRHFDQADQALAKRAEYLAKAREAESRGWHKTAHTYRRCASMWRRRADTSEMLAKIWLQRETPPPPTLPSRLITWLGTIFS